MPWTREGTPPEDPILCIRGAAAQAVWQVVKFLHRGKDGWWGLGIFKVAVPTCFPSCKMGTVVLSLLVCPR